MVVGEKPVGSPSEHTKGKNTKLGTDCGAGLRSVRTKKFQSKRCSSYSCYAKINQYAATLQHTHGNNSYNQIRAQYIQKNHNSIILTNNLH